MNGKELTDKLKELNTVDSIVCSDTELKEYIAYGLLISVGNKYMTRTGKTISVNLLKQKTYRFNIDLSNIIYNCEQLTKDSKIKRVYCMTQATYNKYKEQQLIIQKQNTEYFRLFENELWQIYVL